MGPLNPYLILWCTFLPSVYININMYYLYIVDRTHNPKESWLCFEKHRYMLRNVSIPFIVVLTYSDDPITPHVSC